MRKTRKGKGLLVYGVDYDEYAFRIGELFETSLPEIELKNVVVLKYDGYKPEKEIYERMFDRMNEPYYFSLVKSYFKQKRDWLKEKSAQVSADFVVELHDVWVNIDVYLHPPPHVVFEVAAFVFNEKMRKLLRKYAKEYKYFSVDFGSFTIESIYDSVLVEIFHGPGTKEEEVIKGVIDLLNYLTLNYRRKRKIDEGSRIKRL